METRCNVEVSALTLSRLKELASWSGVALDQALEQAVKELYDRKFWDATNASYAALRADPAAWAEIEAERKAWDATLLDGLDPKD